MRPLPLRLAAAALLSLALAGPAVAAQDATPPASESLLAAMGYPELRIRVTEDTYEMSTTSVAAGRILITLENAGQESWHGFLLRLPEGISDEQVATDLGPEAQEPPSWLFEATFPGFPGETQPGETNSAVVDLAPGEYLIVSDAVQSFGVVGDAATPAAVDPTADGVVRLFEYGFDLPDTLTPGRHVWAVTNAGREPHELLLARSPAPITRDQAMELVMAESQDATPTGGGPSGREILGVGGMGWLSPGQTAWTEVDLEPGTYGVVCYVFDPETGIPHAVMGMVDVFTVGGDGGTPTA